MLFGCGETGRAGRVEESTGLPPPQACVSAAGGEQFGVGAFLDDAAFVEHDEAVEAGGRRQPGHHSQYPAALYQSAQFFLVVRPPPRNDTPRLRLPYPDL